MDNFHRYQYDKVLGSTYMESLSQTAGINTRNIYKVYHISSNDQRWRKFTHKSKFRYRFSVFRNHEYGTSAHSWIARKIWNSFIVNNKKKKWSLFSFANIFNNSILGISEIATVLNMLTKYYFFSVTDQVCLFLESLHTVIKVHLVWKYKIIITWNLRYKDKNQ